MSEQVATIVIYDPPQIGFPYLVVLIWPDGACICAPAVDAITAQNEAKVLAAKLAKDANALRP
jgi:hypothetical protein